MRLCNFGSQEWIGVLTHLDIDLTYKCDLRCFNCCRHVGKGPALSLPLDRVKELIAGSERLGWVWQRWNFGGGEPTMYEPWDELWELLPNYHANHPEVEIWVYSNGHSAFAQGRLAGLPVWVRQQVSVKTPEVVERFTPMNVAPCDLPGFDPDNITPCTLTFQCGMALSPGGFYPCSPSGGIANARGVLGVRHLEQVTLETLTPFYRLCGLCGMYVAPSPRSRVSLRYDGPRDAVSKSWRANTCQVAM
jgi:hypothetical protein